MCVCVCASVAWEECSSESLTMLAKMERTSHLQPFFGQLYRESSCSRAQTVYSSSSPMPMTSRFLSEPTDALHCKPGGRVLELDSALQAPIQKMYCVGATPGKAMAPHFGSVEGCKIISFPIGV